MYSEINSKKTVKIEVTAKMWGSTGKARLYEINGEQRWVPRSVSKFNETGKRGEGILVIEEWYYNKYFKTK